MKKINYAITSFRRPECISVNALVDLGVPPEDITIFLQDEADLAAYSETHPGISKILKKSTGLNANRNNALKHYNPGDYVVLLDDDVISFLYLVAISGEKVSSKKIRDGELFRNIIIRTFTECEAIGCPMWGIAATGNAIIAKNRLFTDGIYSINRLFQGSLIGHINNGIYYDESYTLMTDYELQLRYYRMGAVLIRANDIAPSKKPNGNYNGGLFDEYRIPNKRKVTMERLRAQYPDLIEIKPDWSGLKQKI